MDICKSNEFSWILIINNMCTMKPMQNMVSKKYTSSEAKLSFKHSYSASLQ